MEQGGSRPGATEIRDARESGWLRVIEPSSRALLCLLEEELHAGEAKSIVLALEIQPDILLLDETEARRIAALYGSIHQRRQQGHTFASYASRSRISSRAIQK